jgi:P-type conjugative transfer ATPase TrbB
VGTPDRDTKRDSLHLGCGCRGAQDGDLLQIRTGKTLNPDITLERNLAKLRRDFGETFLAALADPETVEIVLNADGTLRQERLGEPLRVIGTMTATAADAAMRSLAAFHHTTITRESPSIECELPLDGSRFAGSIPPIVPAPVFAVRKRASRVFTLQQYVEAGIMTKEQKQFLCDAIRGHRNLLISGGTGGGKSTLVNGLIHELMAQFPNERLIIIEDTAELQCAAKDYVQFHTSPERSMTQLVRMSMRMRPDRILVGECRGPEALDLLLAWGTGHPGGVCTIHANNAKAALSRLFLLISMNANAPRFIEPFIGEVQPVIVHIERTVRSRRVSEIIDVRGYEANEYQCKVL